MGLFIESILENIAWRIILSACCFFLISSGSVAKTTTLPAPLVSVDSFILIDHITGTVLVEKNADKKMEPASLSKIMTVYVAAQALKDGYMSLSDTTLVSKKAWLMEGSRMFIEVGTDVLIDDLLNGIIVQSGNDSSIALAEHLYGSEESFVEQMNLTAKNLQMTNSSFGNVTGLPDRETYVTARDMTKLSRSLIDSFPDIYKRFKLRSYEYNNIKQRNRNALLFRDSSVDGVKTGYTESAGYCLVSSSKKNSVRLIAAVMGAKSNSARVKDSRTLLAYGFRFFETRRLYDAGEEIATAEVWRGESESVAAGAEKPIFLTATKGEIEKYEVVTEFFEPLRAPIEKGELIGRMEFGLPNEQKKSIDLMALHPVKKAGFFKSLNDEIRLFFQ